MVATGSGNIQVTYSDASGTRRDVVLGPVVTSMLSLGATDPRQRYYVGYQGGQPLRENDKNRTA